MGLIVSDEGLMLGQGLYFEPGLGAPTGLYIPLEPILGTEVVFNGQGGLSVVAFIGNNETFGGQGGMSVNAFTRDLTFYGNGTLTVTTIAHAMISAKFAGGGGLKQ